MTTESMEVRKTRYAEQAPQVPGSTANAIAGVEGPPRHDRLPLPRTSRRGRTHPLKPPGLDGGVEAASAARTPPCSSPTWLPSAIATASLPHIRGKATGAQNGGGEGGPVQEIPKPECVLRDPHRSAVPDQGTAALHDAPIAASKIIQPVATASPVRRTVVRRNRVGQASRDNPAPPRPHPGRRSAMARTKATASVTPHSSRSAAIVGVQADESKKRSRQRRSSPSASEEPCESVIPR